MDFIAFDIETTGTVAGVDHIIEIGFVRFINGEPESTFSTLVDPGIPIPVEAQKVNHINDEMVKGRPRLEQLLGPLTEFCGDLPLVAHNAPFDMAFLTHAYLQYELPTPRGVVIDTLLLARKIIPGLPNYKLGTLTAHFDIASGEFHRAQQDAIYCGEVYLKLLSRIKKDIRQIPLEEVVELTGKPAQYFPVVQRRPKQLGLF
ncbi:MAG: 3'-5' exonuclease [Bdellovibrionaceae bacterium]|nr:3'-5' exonuclease [Pseudobdellovibrionaceae bacterium]MDW8190138.1 3'-5' exonuclease [Pseudobdellovibrionaceae bacterium]